jgi:hypothetical protein
MKRIAIVLIMVLLGAGVARGQTTYRINSGGPAFTDSKGQAWIADKYFTGGGTFCSTHAIAGAPILAAADQTAYKCERWGATSYTLAEPPGTYKLRLLFTELTVPGRKFGVNAVIGGVTTQLLPNTFSIYTEAGGQFIAIDKTFTLVVPAGASSVKLVGVYGFTDDPKFGGIELVPSGVPPPPVVGVAIAPSSATLQTGAAQQFTATVTNATNTAVTWTASCGSVTTAGLYTAPAAAGNCTVTATAQADATKSASAAVTVTAPPPPPPIITLALSPANTSVPAGGTVQFTANVAATWIAFGGNVTAGGLFTAGNGTAAAVGACSQANPAVCLAAYVAISATPVPHSAALSWGASTSAGVTYSVYRATVAGGPYTRIASGLAGLTFTDSSVAAGTTYFYVVTATNAAGESGNSNEATAIIPTP